MVLQSKLDVVKSPKITLHRSGQYRVVFQSKTYYLGTDEHEAHRRFDRMADVTSIGLKVNTVSDLAAEYVAWCQALAHFAQFVGPSRPVSTLSPRDMADYQRKALEEKGAGRTNKFITIIRAAFRRAAHELWLGASRGWVEDLLYPLETRGVTPRETSVFTPEELWQVIGLASDQIRVIILLALNCALGQKDISDMVWGDLDLEAGIMDYRRPKTHRKRRTPLWGETVQALRWWKEQDHFAEPSKMVFHTRHGNPWVRVTESRGKLVADDGLCKAFQKLLHLAGIHRPRCGFYSIRHTAATWAAGRPSDSVREGNEFLLGHASDAMWKVYAHSVPQSVRLAVEAVREALFSVSPDHHTWLSCSRI
jgi:integrase